MQRDRKIGLISFSKSGFAFVELENEATNIDGLTSDALRFERPHEPAPLVRTITRIETPARMPRTLPQKLRDCDHQQNAEPRNFGARNRVRKVHLTMCVSSRNEKRPRAVSKPEISSDLAICRALNPIKSRRDFHVAWLH